MSVRKQVYVGLIFIIVGVLKAWDHSQGMGVLSIPGCLGRDFTVSVSVPIWQQVHCWGCYLAIAGAGLLIRVGWLERGFAQWQKLA